MTRPYSNVEAQILAVDINDTYDLLAKQRQELDNREIALDVREHELDRYARDLADEARLREAAWTEIANQHSQARDARAVAVGIGVFALALFTVEVLIGVYALVAAFLPYLITIGLFTLIAGIAVSRDPERITVIGDKLRAYRH